ncbi:MarR family winged helix-turn-helix transcriptional regulator [Pararhodobacter aggregans]|uniref:MarR family transcriptional regulator n=1 Tax=Pararhodobacter aggregans TaxID=404875 RepID=A0A2T7UTD6_9RHOB|nr:MarR family transcriptional regulator [Pararhodobacter aggregans]PTX02758.1 DNA-binding MarR family transcriptional regulator [Pararhodobacter aggregans]PVE47987.1 MarR family transcriptional regulator [Pararhodobacter aggregans]
MSGDSILRVFMGYDMKRAFAAIQTDVNAVLAPYGLRMLTFSVLSVIRDNPGLRQTQLAEILAIERPNLVLILDELEGLDLVTRTRARDDRRAYELKVTLKGRRLAERSFVAVTEHDDRMARGLSDEERAALHRALRQIQSNGRSSDDARQVSRP